MSEQELIGRTVPIQYRPVSSQPRQKLRVVIQTLILLASLAQALPLATKSTGPDLYFGEGHNVNSLVKSPQTGDLPIPSDVYHRIQIDTSSHQLNMTSLYGAPISTAPPPDMFPRKYHTVSRKYFLNVSADTPLPTNKCVSVMNFCLSRVFLTLAAQILHKPIPWHPGAGVLDSPVYGVVE